MSDFEYTYRDLGNFETAFSDYIVNPELTNPEIFLVGQGIERYLNEWLASYLDSRADAKKEEAVVYVSEDLHNYILSFVGRLINELESRIQQTDQDSYWYDEYREWLGNMRYVHEKLEEKIPI